MTNVPFFTVTVDHIPDYLGELKVVEMAADYESGDSPNEALGALKSGAARSGYHGIIGLRFDNFVRVRGGGMAGIGSATTYFAYGTMVRFG
jgi:uncharacterized protein YbjQ (UPF0145 family)